MKETITLCCIAVEKNGKFLCLKRAPGNTYPGIWEFPSGKLEDNETLIECAKRELLEETGLVGEELKYEGYSVRERFEKDVVANYFLCKNTGVN